MSLWQKSLRETAKASLLCSRSDFTLSANCKMLVNLIVLNSYANSPEKVQDLPYIASVLFESSVLIKDKGLKKIMIMFKINLKSCQCSDGSSGFFLDADTLNSWKVL